MNNVGCADLDLATGGALLCSAEAENAQFDVLIVNGMLTDPTVQLGSLARLIRFIQSAVWLSATLRDGTQTTQLDEPVCVCLRGTGILVQLSTVTTPRWPRLLTTLSDSPAGYVCALTPEGGLIALIAPRRLR